MKKIETIAGIAAPLLVDNIATDIIAPATVIQDINADFAGGLFGPWRYAQDGSELPDFVLNTDRFRAAAILLAGRNFGCGSSREHAVWCLDRYGIQCVIAPSFADIFLESAFKNGLVALTLPAADIDDLAATIAGAATPVVTVDIRTKTIAGPHGWRRDFVLDESRQRPLLEGLTELDTILLMDDDIAAFQTRARAARPWLYPDAAQRDACLEATA